MNKDIAIMLELQGYWDIILSSQDEVSRKKKSISFWNEELADLKKKEVTLIDNIKNIKNTIKNLELDLAEVEGKIGKLEDRKTNIHNERELKAVTNELDLFNENRDEVENKLIELMDDLDENQNTSASLTAELEEKDKQVAKDVVKLTEDINKLEIIIADNNEKFKNISEDLSGTVKSKFLKLIKSKEGKAISEITGEICGFCNFAIPAFLAVDATKDDTVSICTNCGRFIFKR